MQELTEQIQNEIKKAIIGKDDVIRKVLMAVLAQGHILLEDIPGVGKTTLAMAFARALGLDSRRIQFTSDTLPSDIIGFSVYEKESGKLQYKSGAIMTNLLLADEINRTSSKTQSALLEAMEEHQVTVDGVTHPLPDPFVVLATQNPVGSAGTQLLPSAQLDRFLMRLSMGYPDRDSQVALMKERHHSNPLDQLKAVVDIPELRKLIVDTAEVYVADEIYGYVTDLAEASRHQEYIQLGVSPRGALAVCRTAKANAFLKGRDYLVKVNEFTVYLYGIDEVKALLEAALKPYDPDELFEVNVISDTSRELNVFTVEVTPKEELAEGDGLKALNFSEKVEISEAYVDADRVSKISEAIEAVTKETEKNQTYEVQPGDTLSVIANSRGYYVDEVLALNPGLTRDATLHLGDEIVISVPEPELSVLTTEQSTYEEDYDAETQYIENDSWYTTQQVVRQEAVPGHHEVTVLTTSRNGTETSREMVSENVITEPVPEIIEKGTQTPPTYIKPITGGTLTSTFKWRWGRMHKGIDWAVPKGTAVRASCGGTVVSAGWSGGYGNCITIRHPDGKQTRYGHLSKILVSAGQKVDQGQKIALSGNTGRSTGPHVHFEIIVNGSQVNPLKYLQ